MTWDNIVVDKAKCKEILGLAEQRYQSAMLFPSLSKDVHGMLQTMVKNAWTTQQVNLLPKTPAEVVKMTDEFVVPHNGKRVRANTQPGVAFITPDKEVQTTTKVSATIGLVRRTSSKGRLKV